MTAIRERPRVLALLLLAALALCGLGVAVGAAAHTDHPTVPRGTPTARPAVAAPAAPRPDARQGAEITTLNGRVDRLAQTLISTRTQLAAATSTATCLRRAIHHQNHVRSDARRCIPAR